MVDISCIVIKQISRLTLNYICQHLGTATLDLLENSPELDTFDIRIGNYDIVEMKQHNRHGAGELRIELLTKAPYETGYNRESFSLKANEYYKIEIN